MPPHFYGLKIRSSITTLAPIISARTNNHGEPNPTLPSGGSCILVERAYPEIDYVLPKVNFTDCMATLLDRFGA